MVISFTICKDLTGHYWKNITSVIFIASLIISCSDLNKIEFPHKSIKKVGEIVFVEGCWKDLRKTKEGISPINIMSITCDRNNRTCKETISSTIYLTREHQMCKKNKLYTYNYTYQITEWTNDIIKAKWDAPVADIEIMISLKDNFTEKSYCETKARGDQTANPDICGKFVLE